MSHWMTQYGAENNLLNSDKRFHWMTQHGAENISLIATSDFIG
jgi:hypothetical protein